MIIPSISVDLKFNKAAFKAIRDARLQGVKELARDVAREAKKLFSKRSVATLGSSVSGDTLPRRHSGNYRRSIKYKVTSAGIAFVGPSRPMGSHANLLKYGTVKMRRRLVPAEVALAKKQGKIGQYFKNKL